MRELLVKHFKNSSDMHTCIYLLGSLYSAYRSDVLCTFHKFSEKSSVERTDGEASNHLLLDSQLHNATRCTLFSLQRLLKGELNIDNKYEGSSHLSNHIYQSMIFFV